MNKTLAYTLLEGYFYLSSPEESWHRFASANFRDRNSISCDWNLCQVYQGELYPLGDLNEVTVLLAVISATLLSQDSDFSKVLAQYIESPPVRVKETIASFEDLMETLITRELRNDQAEALLQFAMVPPFLTDRLPRGFKSGITAVSILINYMLRSHADSYSIRPEAVRALVRSFDKALEALRCKGIVLSVEEECKALLKSLLISEDPLLLIKLKGGGG